MKVLTALVAAMGAAVCGLASEARADGIGGGETTPAPVVRPMPMPLPPPGTAESDPEKRNGGWAFEEMRYFMGFFFQRGEGLQSQAGNEWGGRGKVAERGNEGAWVIEPISSLRVRQSKDVTHDIVLPVDIVSAASPDSLDLVATASRTNQSFAIEHTITYAPGGILELAFRYGAHFEEPFRSFQAGPDITFHLFEDNTTITLNGTVIADSFDPIQPNGRDAGQAARSTLNGNFSIAQVLSPTTLLDASFGATTQSGTLETTWNTVIVARGEGDTHTTPIYRIGEKFPSNRFRGAAFFRLAQHVPLTHSTVKASYRLYFDEDGGVAHTGEAEVFQYLVPWLYVRAHGRLHFQNAPSYWVPSLVGPVNTRTERTSDSDLETLAAREFGLKLVLSRATAPKKFRASDSFDLSYLRYQRSNDLTVDFASFGYEKSF